MDDVVRSSNPRQPEATPSKSDDFFSRAPTSSLPKGGGAVRGIGEKFAANPVTGTGSISVPIYTSPGRSGFGPQLSLTYDSGVGNGAFGFGWSLSSPSISRKTDKGLPSYFDAWNSDVFILSGAEDLVPLYRQDPDGSWVRAHPTYSRDPAGFWIRDPAGNLVIQEDVLDEYIVRRYRPRIEGLFARIERWTLSDDQDDVHWRATSKDNILTIYGRNDESRIVDPQHAGRIFSWLICETRDDKGNAVLYRYKPEDGSGVNLARVSERNRGVRDDPRRTANRYLKQIYYGNRSPLLDEDGQRLRFLDDAQIDAQIAQHDWMFEVVFDYGDHDPDTPTPEDDQKRDAAGALKWPWGYRQDPFSSYRSGFEVRTTRRCERVLMFHHFSKEEGVGTDCLVRSTDFSYSDEQDPADASNSIYTFLKSVTQSGYRRNNGGFVKRSLPPVEFAYSQPIVNSAISDIDPASLENLPIGLDGAAYSWTDLHGEGLPGILSEQAGAWFYKRNLAPIATNAVEFAPVELVEAQPNQAVGRGAARFMDLAGDGQPDLVVFDGPKPGFYEHDNAESWRPFRPFKSRLNRDMHDPNLRFIDLDGDGRMDVLITEDDALIWHPSLAEEGFGPARKVAQALDEELGPRLVFADRTESIYLADLSGDGLTDLVRIRNGEVCYWPHRGYAIFGAKVSMDRAPYFDNPDLFDQKRIRLADIDGSGTIDIIYLHRDGVRLYFNQSGNGWSTAQTLHVSPRVDDVVSIVPIDLLGNGTACLVWSSPLPGDARGQMRYVDLMGGQKPHLLVKTVNNLGAETHVDYAPSTKFYLEDKLNGKPWITKLPFPVHVVEKVETFDYISRNRFVTRYAYHHGHFDADEREFRGFAMVEQFDTEQFAALADSTVFPVGTNVAVASQVPPLYTKTWFHTGIYLGRNRVSNFFAGLLNATDQGEYFREPGLTDADARTLLLPDTILPMGLTLAEEREASRSLKGSMLRQEVYALDGSAKEPFPYTVTEQNFTVSPLQPRERNLHAVFFTHPREEINYHYERNPADPRIQHALTLEVDNYGNVLKEAAIGYGRRATISMVDEDGTIQKVPNPGLGELTVADQAKQTTLLTTYIENLVTNAIENAEVRRNPLLAEARTFELTGYTPSGPAGRFQFADFVEPDLNSPGRLRLRFDSEISYESSATNGRQRRPIEWVRSLFRRDDLSALLPLAQLESRSLPGESYKLAFTPGLLTQVFQRPHAGQAAEPLIPNPAAVLAGQAGDRGGYVQSQILKADGRFPATDADDYWWIPSGRSYFSPDPTDNGAAEAARAIQHFFLSRRYRDPFGQDGTLSFDAYDLLPAETRDALGNRITVDMNDYRVLQSRVISDANRNQTAVAFDTLGMVAGTAVMGKPLPAAVEGDSLTGFVADLTQAQTDGFFSSADPHMSAPALLLNATTRIVYDLDRFMRTQSANPLDPTQWLPPYAATLARETHASDRLPSQGLKIQISFSYSDGFGREIQKKMQAEPMKTGGVIGPPRWVGSGWTIFNNKGKPVRRYEPFFSANHVYEFGVLVGVSPVLFYDPTGRVVATLQPNHTYEKVVFDPWRQTIYDVNDTVAPRNTQTGDPRTDPDISGYMAEYFKALPVDPAHPWQTWYQQRTGGGLGAQEQSAAAKAAAHADTPTTAHFDTLGRLFITVTRNRVVCAGHPLDGTEDTFATRLELDIESNQRAVRDAIVQNGDPQGRIVMQYAYDMLSNRVRQLSMEAGARWMLNDVVGKPIRRWDSRGHNFSINYDVLRRPSTQTVRGTNADSDPRALNGDIQIDRSEYGEGQANPEALNLRTRMYRHFDSAGVAVNEGLNPNTNQIEAYDFKGNLLRSTRQLVSDYKSIPDWQRNPLLVDERFTSSTRYDAMNRPTQSIAPHSSLPRAKCNVIQPVFNEANLLERVDVWLNRAAEPASTLDPAAEAPSAVGVANIDYDAKSQRQRIDYKNAASTLYDYDPLTFRLVQLTTNRNAVTFPNDCPQPAPNGWPGCLLQNLSYSYDSVGNITHIQDDAQQTIYFKNLRVEPSNDYTYDAAYRLIEATGREHLGQGGAPIAHSSNDAGRVGLSSHVAGHFGPNDGNAMGTYTEWYVYDAVGNFQQMQHRGANPAQAWSRGYTYTESSLIENGAGGKAAKTSNRLTETTVNLNGNNPIVEPYQHDVHGNMIRMPHLGEGAPNANMQWDYQDRLIRTDQGGGGKAYHVYDALGQRVRKVWEKSAGLTEERIYLAGFEIFRRHPGAIGADTATLERETLHVMDDQRRVALVETRTIDTAANDAAPALLIRYQLGNHLDSACLELDDQAQIISYEEYAPYGSSTYQAVRSMTETPKRYRYTAKERDEESGFSYFGARYYASWIGRWTSTEPQGLMDDKNLYLFVRSQPANHAEMDGRGWRDAARGFAHGLAFGIGAGLLVGSLAVSGPALLVIGAAGLIATGLSVAKTHADYKSGKISPEQADEQYGDLAGGLVGGFIGGAGANGFKGALTSLAENVEIPSLAPELLPAGSGPGFSAPPPLSPIPPTVSTGASISVTPTTAVTSMTAGVFAVAATGGPGTGSSGNEPTPTTSSEPPAPKESSSEPPVTEGTYRSQAGHHVYQSASYSQGGPSETGNPNHSDAVTVALEGHSSDISSQHGRATAVQRLVNRAAHGRFSGEAEVGSVTIKASGEGTLPPTPNASFEDVKALYSMSAADAPGFQSAEDLFGLVSRAAAQLPAPPVRVPTR